MIHEIKYDLREIPLKEFPQYTSAKPSQLSTLRETFGLSKLVKSSKPLISASSVFYTAELSLIMRLDAHNLRVELHFKNRLLYTADILEAIHTSETKQA